MNQTLQNDILKVTASTAGAELQNITGVLTGYEYLWQGNPAFWKRRSPVLFPIVGSVWNGVFHMDGCEFPMSQHGFARDMEFEIMPDTPEDEMWFSLEYTDETLAKYPRKFRLEIGYSLLQERIGVMWRVRNLDNRRMYFQIGGHPAFNLPQFNPADEVHGYFALDSNNLTTEVIAEKNCVGTGLKPVALTDGLLPIERDTFSHNALIIGVDRVHRVSLLTPTREPVLSLLFRTPYVGLWAPSADAPFVCIEPWYGRADSAGFTEDFSGKAAVRSLEPGETFEGGYTIIIENV